MKKKYCYSWDDERYQGKYDTEEKALDAAKRDKPEEDEVYIGTCTEPEFKWRSCEEDIIESIEENLFDDVGEAAENFEVSRENEIELAKMIDETVMRWIEKNNITPDCYSVLDGHLVSIVQNQGLKNLVKKVIAYLYYYTFAPLLTKAHNLQHWIEDKYLCECRSGCENCYRWRCLGRRNAGPYKKIRR